MITPVDVLTIGKLCERQNDLLMSADDIKELARNERIKTIDEFAERLKDKVLNHFTYKGIIEEPTEYADYIDEIAEQLKGGAT